MNALRSLFISSTSARDASELFSDILPWLIVLIVLVIVGGAIIYWVKRTLGAATETAAEPFTLHGLRQMRASGQITDEEFERARAAMIGRLKASAEDAESPNSETESPDAADDNEQNESGNDSESKNSG